MSSPLCALFVARPTSAVENNWRYMTFRQVHRSGEHWNFLIIVSSQRSRANLERLRLRLEKTIPVPAPDPAPSKMSRRLRLRLRTKLCRFRRLQLRIPATLPSRNCLPAVSPSMPCSWPGQHLSDTVLVTYNRSGEHWYFLINVLQRHPGIVYRQRSPYVPCSWPSQHLSNTVRRITALVSIGIS